MRNEVNIRYIYVEHIAELNLNRCSLNHRLTTLAGQQQKLISAPKSEVTSLSSPPKRPEIANTSYCKCYLSSFS